jgi:hypothetical protein
MRPRLPHAASWLVLGAVGLAVFGNALVGGYHLDDAYRISGNPEIDVFWPPWRHFFDPGTSSSLPTIEQFRPLLPLTLTITAALGDTLGLARPVAHRWGNLAIAVATAVIVLRVFQDLLARRADYLDPATRQGVAWTAALVYLVHPVAGIGINYLCARDLLMMQAFLWLGLLSILWAADRPGWRDALPALFVLASLCAKTNAVMTPVLFGVFAALGLGRGFRDRQLWRWVGGSAVAVAAFLAYTHVVLDFWDVGQTMVERAPFDVPRTQAKLHVLHYGRNFVWPFRIRLLPDVELVTTWSAPGMWLGVVVIVAALVLAWRWRASRPLVSLAIVAYFVSIGPTTSFVSMRQLAADYRPVPGLPWLCLLLALAIWTWPPRNLRASVAALVLAYFAGCSVLMHPLWRTDEAAWAQSLRYGGTPQAHVNYALAVAGRDADLAEAHYREALRRAPNNVFAHINLAMLDLYRGRIAEGIERLERARGMAPDWELTQTWLHKGCDKALRSSLPSDARTSRALARCRTRLSRG